VTATVDGARTPWRDGGVELALGDEPRVVELRWTGGLALEPPVCALEPGQADDGVRVLEFAAEAAGWRLHLEGPAGGSAVLRLHGEAPASAEGATLGRAGPVAEAKVEFPRSAAAFSRAEIRLRR
jgi:hypothetical protein